MQQRLNQFDDSESVRLCRCALTGAHRSLKDICVRARTFLSLGEEKSMNKILGLAVLALGISAPAFAAPVAYWRFETGPANSNVIHTIGAGQFEGTIPDVSGNGNTLSVWEQGGGAGYQYRTDVPFSPVPGTGATNNFSVKNTGGGPAMFTGSSVSMPSGVDVETMTP